MKTVAQIMLIFTLLFTGILIIGIGIFGCDNISIPVEETINMTINRLTIGIMIIFMIGIAGIIAAILAKKEK